MFKSVFSKYFSFLFLILCISFVALAGTQAAFSVRYWIQDKEVLLVDNAKSLATTIAMNAKPMPTDEQRYILNSDKESITPIVINSLSKSLEADVIVTDKRGVVLISSEMAELKPGGSISSDFMSTLSKDDAYFKSSSVGGLYERNCFVAGVSCKKNDTLIGYVFIVAPSRSLMDYLAGNFSIYIISVLASMILCTIIVYVFTKRITKPLQDMATVARKFGEGDFTARLSVKGQDEVAELATSLNEMAISLGEVESVSRDFIGNISHELRTPMTTISGFVDGILDGTIPKEKSDYYLQIVSDEVHRLSRLVTAMLNMSRIDKQTLKINPKKFDITELTGKTLLSFESRIETKQIAIEGIDACNPCTISADEDLIGQVIYNLVDNAIKFCDTKGTITLGIHEQDQKVFFTVRNTGVGINSEEMRHIFNRFYKSDRSRSLDKTGAGLGLFIVKNVINMHHGEITVRSIENEYAEFSFWLPK